MSSTLDYDIFTEMKDVINPYFSRELLRKEKTKPVIRYGKKRIQIARRFDGSIFSLDLADASRVIIIGLAGSGKTYLVRSICDRLRQVDYDIVFLNDVKNEMFTSNKPVQEKFRTGLLEGEKPQGMKVVTLRPTFFKTINKKLEKRNYWYSVDMSKLRKSDFMTFMNVESMKNVNQRTAIEIIYHRFEKMLKKDPKLQFSMKLMMDLVDEIDEISAQQKKSLKFKFMPLANAKFYEEKYQRSLVDLIRRGYVIAFNMDGFDAFNKGSFLFPEITLSICLSEIIEARKPKFINDVWVVIDEASRFIGESKNTSIKEDVMESVDVNRRHGISYANIFQSLVDVPERILKQSRYLFIPHSADVKTIAKSLVDTGSTRYQQRANNDALEIKDRMKKHKFSWIVFDRFEQRYDLINILPPLSWHLETKD